MSRKVPFEITPAYTFGQAAKATGLTLAGSAALGLEVLKLIAEFHVRAGADWDIAGLAADAILVATGLAAFAGARDVVTEFMDDKENEKNLPAWEEEMAKFEAAKARSRARSEGPFVIQ